ncbi:MAG: hypothetical protein ACOVQM_14345 [Pirellula sp.]|jgi:hypothetical protein
MCQDLSSGVIPLLRRSGVQPDRSSRNDTVKNADGSVDLVFGPTQAYLDRSCGWPEIGKIKKRTYFLSESRHFIT